MFAEKIEAGWAIQSKALTGATRTVAPRQPAAPPTKEALKPAGES
jgi:hypothetical protein